MLARQVHLPPEPLHQFSAQLFDCASFSRGFGVWLFPWSVIGSPIFLAMQGSIGVSTGARGEHLAFCSAQCCWAEVHRRLAVPNAFASHLSPFRGLLGT
jgi:hypothetical protein